VSGILSCGGGGGAKYCASRFMMAGPARISDEPVSNRGLRPSNEEMLSE